MGVTRRQFLNVGAGTLGGSALGGSVLGFNIAKADQVKQKLRIQGVTVSHSVCPYFAMGCSLLAYTKKAQNGKVELLQIEGDPDSPVNEVTRWRTWTSSPGTSRRRVTVRSSRKTRT